MQHDLRLFRDPHAPALAAHVLAAMPADPSHAAAPGHVSVERLARQVGATVDAVRQALAWLIEHGHLRGAR